MRRKGIEKEGTESRRRRAKVPKQARCASAWEGRRKEISRQISFDFVASRLLRREEGRSRPSSSSLLPRNRALSTAV
eukprot:scaffold133746_cov23-Tisochrysis_lutea.AAC.1